MQTIEVKAALPSGAVAVYEVPNVIRALYPNQTGNARAISFGTLVAVKNNGTWYDKQHHRSAWSVRITDQKVVARLEAVPFADDVLAQKQEH